MPWQDQSAIRDEYAKLLRIEADDRTQRISQFVRGLLNRIVFLTNESDAPLEPVNNLIMNYDLHLLSRLNPREPDSVRAARFKDGLFYSFRIRKDKDTIIQHNFSFFESSTDFIIPRLATRVLRDYGRGQIVQSFLPTKHFLEDFELHEEPIPSLIMKTADIIDKEASSSPPWLNAYTPSELRDVRRRPLLRQINRDQIRINPAINEPYL